MSVPNEVRTHLVRARSARTCALSGKGLNGARQTRLVDASTGSVHQEVVIMELAPGGTIPGHYHPFEESFFILEGNALFAVAGQAYRVGPGDYGLAPIATPHAWRNESGRPVRWLEIRAPQPKIVADADGTYADPDVEPPASGRQISLDDPTCRWVGHFADDQMPAPGPIATQGANNYRIKHISTRILVDDALGAVQQITFIGQLPGAPASDSEIRDLMEADPVAKCHYHPYEEVYHFLSGRGLAYLDGRSYEIEAGDTILCATGGSHSVINTGPEPLRWLETQAPRPPEQYGMFWEKDWMALEALKITEEPAR